MTGGAPVDVWAWVAPIEDGEPQVVGIPTVQDGRVEWVPLIGPSLEAMQALRLAAQHAATKRQRTVRLVHFSGATVVEVVNPQDPRMADTAAGHG